MNDRIDPIRAETERLSNDHPGASRPATLSDRVRSLRLENPPATRGSRFGWLPWVLCAVFALLAIGFGVQAFTPAGAFGPPKKPAAPDDAAKAGSGDVVLEAKGYIIPSRTYQVSPKVSGMVKKLYIQKEGDFFHKGEPLAELETDDYGYDVDHAGETLKNAQARWEQLKKELPEEIKKAAAELEQSKSQLRQYMLDWERAQELYLSHNIAKSDYDLARANKEAKESEVNKLTHALALVKRSEEERYRALEAEVKQDKADHEKAKWRLGNCYIVAPADGTILTKNVEEGNLANPIAFQAAVAASICTMADLSKLEVDISIQERDIKLVKEGQPCRVVAEGFPDRKPYEGVVLRKMPTADRAKGAIPVRIQILKLQDDEKPGEFLRPDIGVIVSFLKVEDKK
jgi:HlyD family secretion protein